MWRKMIRVAEPRGPGRVVVGRITTYASDAARVLDQIGERHEIGQPAARLVWIEKVPADLLQPDLRRQDDVERTRA
jgi:hypothetical protein